MVPIVWFALVVGGHISVWILIFNIVHASPFPCRWVKLLERGCIVVAATPLACSPWIFSWVSSPLPSGWAGAWAMVAYVELARRVACRVARAFVDDRPSEESTLATTHVEQFAGEGRMMQILSRVPGNEVGSFVSNRKVLSPRRWRDGWSRTTLAHISDLHVSGRMALPFYKAVVEQTNELGAQAIVISGDIIENPQCWPWMTDVLADLEAPLGVYFLLGNHDARMGDDGELRAQLAELGWVDIGGQCVEVPHGDDSFLLFGNERPWFAQLPEPPELDDRLRVGVLHTPDQFSWAARQQADVVLAGHTHGGQIRLPLAGPLVCPSLFDVWYAGGVFRQAGSVMHVSRGVAALHPIRFNCLPEITLIELQDRNAEPSLEAHAGTRRRSE